MLRLLAIVPILSSILLAASAQGKSPGSATGPRHPVAASTVDGHGVKTAPGVATKLPPTVVPAEASAPAAESSKASAKQANTSVQAPARSPRMTPQQQDALQEILRIRKMQGDIFQGTVFASSKTHDDQQFVKALEEVIRSSPAAKVTTPPLPNRAALNGMPAGNLSYDQNIGQPMPAVSASRNDPALTATLRDTAELLDAKANLLERSGAYKDADRLRGIARRLRHEARRWAPETSGTARGKIRKRP